MADKSKLTIRILILIIALLALAVLYAFVIRPTVSGFVMNKQIDAYNQGQTDLLNNILVQLQQTGNAQISVGDEYTLTLTGRLDPVSPSQ